MDKYTVINQLYKYQKVFICMETKQVNLTLPKNLLEKSQAYAEQHGFRNVQELATEALREKVFNVYDQSLTEKETGLVDKPLETSVSKGKIKSEKELMKALGS